MRTYQKVPRHIHHHIVIATLHAFQNGSDGQVNFHQLALDANPSDQMDLLLQFIHQP